MASALASQENITSYTGVLILNIQDNDQTVLIYEELILINLINIKKKKIKNLV